MLSTQFYVNSDCTAEICVNGIWYCIIILSLLTNCLGEPLTCLPYRAWAPGHPKAERLKKDCVVLTSNRYWETEDCSKKLPFICELIPDGPLTNVERYCAPISNTSESINLR